MSTLTINFTKYTPGGSPPADVDYAANAATSGKYARSFDPGGYIQDVKRFRAPGTNGYYLVRSGAIGRKLTVVVRYIGDTLALAATQAQTDMKQLATGSYNITALGVTYKGCNLVPGSVQQTSPYLATGRVDGQSFFDIVMMFTEDQPDA